MMGAPRGAASQERRGGKGGLLASSVAVTYDLLRGRQKLVRGNGSPFHPVRESGEKWGGGGGVRRDRPPPKSADLCTRARTDAFSPGS